MVGTDIISTIIKTFREEISSGDRYNSFADHREVPHTLQRYRDSASGVWNCFFEDLMRSLREHPTKVHRTKTSIDDTTMQNSCSKPLHFMDQ